MAKLRDAIPEEEWVRWEKELDAMSEEERKIQTNKVRQKILDLGKRMAEVPSAFDGSIAEKIANLQESIGTPFKNSIEGFDKRVKPPEEPEFDSPVPKMLDIMKDLLGEQKKANKARKSTTLIAWLAVFVAIFMPIIISLLTTNLGDGLAGWTAPFLEWLQGLW